MQTHEAPLASFQAIIFDLDGTLLDTLKDIAASANRVLGQFGYPTHEIDRYRYYVGDGLPALITRVLPEADRGDANLVARCLEAFRADYTERWKDETAPYDGIAETLDHLAKRRLPMAILSNKPDDFSKLCVAELLPRRQFEVVMGLREGVPAKPNPTGALKIAGRFGTPPERVLYVGDTSIDMKTALAAGMFPAGALWGFRSREELEASGARALLEKPQDIIGLVASTQ